VGDNVSDDFLHDLKQPLNLIRVLAQDVRLDVTKDRLEIASLPETMTEIEAAVDELVTRLDELRESLRSQARQDVDDSNVSHRDELGSTREH
jgi:signal transduction histidine kinase